ncbi:MAG: hypothetical protein K2P93_01835 [Alphaproteobacteria bacterium]|nr:hypothetical protein [Alphaproteobacteria bacterium]
MKIIRTTTLFLFLQVLLMEPTSADNFSVDAKMGSLGIGMDVSFRISPYASINGSVNGFGLSTGLNNRDVDFNGTLRLLTAGANLGIHPFCNDFKFTAGAFYNGNQFNLTSKLRHNVTLQGKIITPEEVGKPKATAYFNRVSPYLGIGFDSTSHTERGWSLYGELGILFQGTPKAKLKAKGHSEVTPLVKNYIVSRLKISADKFLLNYYPVISIGVKYSF